MDEISDAINPQEDGESEPAAPRVLRPIDPRSFLFRFIGAAAISVPLFVDPTGKDYFRLPKEALFRAGGVIVIALALVALLAGTLEIRNLRLSDRFTRLLLAIGAWTIVSAMVSTNRVLSFEAALTVLCSLVIAAITYELAPSIGFGAADLLLVPALMNSIVLFLQELEIWNPFQFSPLFTGHLTRTALIGNPNDVGSTLVVPALISFAVMLTATRTRSIVHGAGAVVICAAILVSQTITALGGLIAGIATLLVLRFRRRAAAALIVLTIAAAGLAFIHAPVKNRLAAFAGLISRGQYNQLLSFRVPAFLSAIEMTKQRPIAGMGPGTFKWHYFEFKNALPTTYARSIIEMPSSEQFAEVHSDHLQVLAEAGLPGYALLLCSLALLASTHRAASRDADELDPATDPERNAVIDRSARRELARIAGLALAIAFFVLALAQFPLQIAAARMMFLYAGALVLGWTHAELIQPPPPLPTPPEIPPDTMEASSDAG